MFPSDAFYCFRRATKAIDLINDNMRGAVRMTTKKNNERYETWRKEIVNVLRIMLNHVALKRRYYEKATNAKEPGGKMTKQRFSSCALGLGFKVWALLL